MQAIDTIEWTDFKSARSGLCGLWCWFLCREVTDSGKEEAKNVQLAVKKDLTL